MIESDIARLRLQAQQIAVHQFQTPAELVRHMGAIQAQDYAGSKWAIGARLPNVTEADVEKAVANREILRTWPQRGTIHFVVPDEVRWRLSLTSERILRSAKRRHENLSLTQADFDKALDLFRAALHGDKQLSRPDMMKVLEDGGISTAGQRGYHILWYLAQTGHLCFGPLQGKQPTFALLDEWVPSMPEMPREEALKRLTTTYFRSHGPATVQDLMWWSGITATEIKMGLELAKSELTSVDIDGRIYWMARDLPDMMPSKPSVYLLPPFDEYLLGYKDRTHVLDAKHFNLVVPGGNGVFSPLLVIDGKIQGIWRKTVKKNEIIVKLSPFTRLTSMQNETISGALTSYGNFMGMSARLD